LRLTSNYYSVIAPGSGWCRRLMPNLSLFFKSVKLPAMPEVAHALIKTLNKNDVTAARVRDLIAKDPALTATLLRMANSALFGLSQSISSLDTAIRLVGLSQIRSHALSVCLRNAFPVVSHMDRIEFWRGSMATAAYAQWLCSGLALDQQQAWLTGMMLRLGELLIAQQDPVLIEGIEKRPCAPGERWVREQRLTGFSEGQITAELARRWDFPAEMVHAFEAAAHPLAAQPFSPIGAVLHLAGRLADVPNARPLTLASLPPDVVNALQLNGEWMQATMPSVHSLLDVTEFTDLSHGTNSLTV